jgi:hypothetical protein
MRWVKKFDTLALSLLCTVGFFNAFILWINEAVAYHSNL